MVTYGGAPTAYFDPVRAAEPMPPQQQKENQEQVNMVGPDVIEYSVRGGVC